MALSGALRLSLACLLLCGAAPKPACDPGACRPCPEGDPEGTASPPSEGGCCRPCPEGDPEGTASPPSEGGCCPPCPEGDPEGTASPPSEGGCCPPCPEGDPEGTASPPSEGGCCPPCPPPCACPPYLHSDCEMQGFAGGRVPAGRSFYIDFARTLCTCRPSGDIACAPLCPRLSPACLAVGSPLADGCPRCVCYDEEEMAVPAGTVTARGSRLCSCPARGGRLRCGPAGSEQ